MKLKKHLWFGVMAMVLTACSTQQQPAMSDAIALAQLDRLERLDEREYQKARVRDEDNYRTERSRRLDGLEDDKVFLANQKIYLQNEKIHYQNQGIIYQNSRQQTKDAIDDLGRIQMNEAKAINKANENISRKQDNSLVIIK